MRYNTKIVCLPSAVEKLELCGNCQIQTFAAMPNPKLILPFFLFSLLQSPLEAQNDKQVLGDAVFTPAEIADGATAMFLIRFQNLGIDTALNIVVRDTLDPRFDASTFVMVDASHDHQLLQEQGYIRWYFSNIRLPADDAHNHDFSNSSGYVIFTVQPRAFLDPGQYIQNRACITFDDQSPICTNYATIWIDEGAVADEPKEAHLNDFKIIPNPNYGHFEVRANSPKPVPTGEKVEWWISDMAGKTIWDGSARDLATAPNEVMLERPAPGLYMLWMKESGRLQVKQFAIVR